MASSARRSAWSRRAQLGERAFLLIPDGQPDSIRAIASGILGPLELAELDRHLKELAGVAGPQDVPTGS